MNAPPRGVGRRVLPPVGEPRPLWSVMVPTRDCGVSIARTLESVLANDVGAEQMEIAVIDDGSTDRALEGLVSTIGQGRIAYFRHSRPVGAARTFNSCIRRARGHWIHLLHADDLVLDGFYAELGAAVAAEKTARAAFCRARFIDELGRCLGLSLPAREGPGIVPEFLSRLAVTNIIRAPAIVVARRAYERLGGFRPELGHAADWEMWMRVAAAYPIAYVPTPLAAYRIHDGSDGAGLRRTGRNVVDAARAVGVASQLLPRSERHLTVDALATLGRQAIADARSFARKGDVGGAIAQLREGIPLVCDLETLHAGITVLASVTCGAGDEGTKRERELDVWRAARHRASRLLLETCPADLERVYLGRFGMLRRELDRSPLRCQPLTQMEERFAKSLLGSGRGGYFSSILASRVLAGGLYGSRSEPIHARVDASEDERLLGAMRRCLFSLRAAIWAILIRAFVRVRVRRRPTIALAVGSFLPTIRGDALHVAWIADGLRARGYSPVVVAPRQAGDPLALNGIPIVAMPSIVRSFDLALTYSVSQTTRAAGQHARKSQRCRWMHHPCTMTGGGLAEAADRVLAMSSLDERLARAVGVSDERITRLRPAAHPSRLGRPGSFRARFGIDGAFVLWAGAWTPAKGVRNLCERFALFLNRHPRLRLTLVMFGGYGHRERALAHPRIRFFDGNMRDVPAAIADCLFVAFNSPAPPAGYDATPLVLLEALMHGKTFVAQAGTPLLDEIKMYGMVVQTDEEWLAAVESLVFDEQRRRALERLCRDGHRQKYNFDQMISGLDAALSELLAPATLDNGRFGATE